MKNLIALFACTITLSAAPAFAQQLAPTPHAAPRTPVNRETLAERSKAPPRDVEGQALILDGEKLRIGGVDLRLFGIVPPQLSASFGPQARASLDALIGGGQTVACHVRDRDHDGRLLATCRAANNNDPALELLRRGLAVAARGSIAETEYAAPYVSAEQAAQNAKLGLWSSLPPPAAAPEAPKSEPAKAAPPTETQTKEAPKEVQAKTASVMMLPVKAPPQNTTDMKSLADNPGLFARYQVLIAGLLMLGTGLSILGAFTIHRHREKREEMKALAAALRGELLAARAVCLTRIKSITTADDDRATNWPRIRATLYQAYVGRLGWLGAELARQIASIYGQASDYASYYAGTGESHAATLTPKRQALRALIMHIDEVLPRLAAMEQTGARVTRTLAVPPMPSLPIPDARPLLPSNVASRPATAPRKLAPPVPTTKALPSAGAAGPDVHTKLLNIMRGLRDRFIEPPLNTQAEVPFSDYTSLIEEDAARFSFHEDDVGIEHPEKITRNESA